MPRTAAMTTPPDTDSLEALQARRGELILDAEAGDPKARAALPTVEQDIARLVLAADRETAAAQARVRRAAAEARKAKRDRLQAAQRELVATRAKMLGAAEHADQLLGEVARALHEVQRLGRQSYALERKVNPTSGRVGFLLPGLQFWLHRTIENAGVDITSRPTLPDVAKKAYGLTPSLAAMVPQVFSIQED